MQTVIERTLTEEQRMMRQTMRAFVDEDVTLFIRKNWQLEWDMKPENRPSVESSKARTRSGCARSAYPRNSAAHP